MKNTTGSVGRFMQRHDNLFPNLRFGTTRQARLARTYAGAMMSENYTGCGAVWLARLNGVQEVVGSNPASPTVFQKEPFDENVEGLSHCGDGSCGSQIMFK